MERTLPVDTFRYLLEGALAALHIPHDDAQSVFKWLASRGNDIQYRSINAHGSYGTRFVCDTLNEGFARQDKSSNEGLPDIKPLLDLVIPVAIWRQYSRDDLTPEPDTLNAIWNSIRHFLLCAHEHGLKVSIARSAQGFLAIPLCSIVTNGRIVELFRLHIWLPDGKRGSPKLAIHSHQAFGESLIIAGTGTDHQYQVEHVRDDNAATHAEYVPVWSDGRDEDRAYKTVQTKSTLQRTEKMARVTKTHEMTNIAGARYSVPAGIFHSSEVPADVIHATLFFFDSTRGFVFDAGVLGPKNGDGSTVTRDPGNVSVVDIVTLVDTVRWALHGLSK